MYAIWDEKDEPLQDHPMHIPAPKMSLPGTLFWLISDHSESYNPPEEYLLDEQELKEWQDLDPEDRPMNYIPKK